MKFGVFCNQQRGRTDVAKSWQEDIDEIVMADKLGMDEAWISEHTGSTWLPDALPAPDHMICALSRLTQQIRLGPAIRRLALYHPVQVAVETAVCDQLTQGRYMFGFGRGGPVSGWGQRGTEWEQTHEMMVEGIDLMMRCFREDQPFDHDGKYYRGKAISVYPKPVQMPHPPIYVATGNPTLLRMAVDRGFGLLTSQFARPGEIKRLANLLHEAASAARITDHACGLTAVRGVYIADTDAKAVADVERDWKAHIEFNKKYFPMNYKEWKSPETDITDVDFKMLHDRGLMFIGSATTVLQRIRDFYEESGGFDTFLLITGRDWGTLAQRKASMQLFRDAIMPKLAHLSPSITPTERLAVNG